MAELNQCPACGASCDPGDAFCDNCGSKLGAETLAPPSAESTTRCPACGGDVRAGKTFCRHCGASVAGAAAGVASASAVRRPGARRAVSGRLVGALIAVLVVAVSVVAIVLFVAGGDDEGGTLTVLATNDDLEASPLAVLYLGRPADHAFELPQGGYSLLAMDADGKVAEAHASLASDGVVPLGDLDFESGATEEERLANQENMAKVLEFFALNDYAVLSYAERMMRTGGEFTDDDIAAQFDEMTDLQVSIEEAIAGLTYFAERPSVRRPSSSYVLAVPPRLAALPRSEPGVVSLLSEMWKFGKTLTGAAEDSRQKVLEGMAALPDDSHRQQLLNELKPELRRSLGIPDDATDFVQKLRDGDLDYNASQIHRLLSEASNDPSSNLIGLSNYVDHAQNTNSRPIDQAHKHGKKMVEQGTKLNLAVWKEVIGAAQGSAKVKAALQGAIDKGNLIYDLSVKPGETLTKEGLKKLLEQQLKDKLLELGVPADEIAGVIGVLADKLFEKLKAQKADLVDEEDEDEDEVEAVLSPPRPENLTPSTGRTPATTPASTALPRRTPTAASSQPTTAPPTVPPPTATTVPDTSWIEPFVQGIANQLLSEGYSGIDVALAIDELRACLFDFALDGWTKEEALYFCQDVVYSILPPKHEETPAPAPTATRQPVPTATSAPQPAGGQVTAVGQVLPNAYDEGNPISESYIRLEFNTAGGPVNGQGRFQYTYTTDDGVPCYFTVDYTLSGQYSAATGRFDGQAVARGFRNTSPDGSASGYVFQCSDVWEDGPGAWEATLTGNRIAGSIHDFREFEATVQG